MKMNLIVSIDYIRLITAKIYIFDKIWKKELQMQAKHHFNIS